MDIDKIQLNHVLSESVQRSDVPAVAAQISTSEETIYRNEFGFSNFESKALLKEDSLYRIASMTKAITSVCVVQLIERGKLSLDSRLKDFFPHISKIKVLDGFDINNTAIYSKTKEDITVKHLLTHTSGFAYEIWNENILKLNNQGILSSAFSGDNKFLQSPLVNNPGAGWEYGIGIDWLGALVEKITDMTLQDFMIKNIFIPLEMKDTSYDLDFSKQERLVSVHCRNGNRFSKLPFETPEDTNFYSGGGNLISSLNDYANFLGMLLNYGNFKGKQILRKESLELIRKKYVKNELIHKMKSFVPFLSNDFDFFQGKKGSWGLGFLINDEQSEYGKPRNSLGSYGLFNSFCWIDYHNNITAILIMQLLPFFDEKAILTLNNFEKCLYRDCNT